jgi:hypothetical protein
MTSQSPRIYIYKITFLEVPYYYYGVHKEKMFDEYYMGSPVTHKWVWELYTPKKQILELFEYSDEDWIEAQKVEKRLIKPVYNTDKWCLNQNCGGLFSLDTCSRAGKKSGNKHKENGTGFFKISAEERTEISKKWGIIGGKIAAEKQRQNKIGFHNSELQSELGKRGGKKTKELGVGIFGISLEEKSEISRKNGIRMKNQKKGIFSLSQQELRENALKNKENKLGIFGMSEEEKSLLGKKNGKNTSKQKWMCLETGYISSPGPLTLYQKAKGIDTSKRKRVE